MVIRKMFLTKQKKLIFLAFIISIAGCINAVSSQPQPPPKKPLLHPSLKGEPIDILIQGGYPEPIYITLPANEPYYITHGWIHDGWNELSPEEKRLRLDETAVGFRLYIDDEPVEMRKWICHYRTYYSRYSEEWLEDCHVVNWYVQFEPGDFIAGETYTFKGVWYWEGEGEWPLELCITFE